jgi:TolB-like protein/Tfp pilus assembly protein PilF
MADLSERLQAALAHRYAIERVLGHGGMATVYLARDLKEPSRRHVAIKVLPPESALAVRTSRFLREIKIAGQLTHPGILALYESGEVDGFHYYVMPFVEGASLRDRLATGPLPVPEAVRIAREIAEALDYAHRSGTVHRDITPANLLFIESHPVIADFGIARGVDPSRDAEITDKGGVLGTPAYMSPEQVRGADVDARSDIYSLACVLYEMLEGHPPFVGPTGDAVRAQHVADLAPPLKRRGVPSTIAAAIAKALEKRLDERYQTAAEFGAALAGMRAVVSIRRVAALAAGLGAVGLLAAAAPRDWWSGADSPIPSVAVLPIECMSGPVHDYFCEGMTEEVINTLQMDGLRVSPRTSPVYRDSALSIQQIGDRLGVEHVLESSARIEGDSIRIIARLVAVDDGNPVWSRSFNRRIRRVIDLQQEIAWAIVRGLQVQLRGNETPLVPRRYTQNETAFDFYLRGRYFWNRRNGEAMRKAIESFELAIREDSMYALAYSGLADSYVLSAQYSYLPRERAYRQAKVAALRAVALDESLAEAHTSLAKVYQAFDWNWQAAEREYRRAIELNPKYPLARTWYGMLLGRGLARHDEAIRQAQIGYALDSLSAWANNNFSVILNHARRHDDAIYYARRAVDLAPEWGTAHGQLARTYRWKGMYAEALAEHAIAARLGQRSREAAGVYAIYARTGRRAEVLEAVAELRARAPRDPVWVNLALLYVSLDDADNALAALDSAITRRSFPFEPNLASSPDWDPLRTDRRFTALLRRIGLPP